MVEPDSSVKELKGVGAKTAKSLEENGRGTVRRLATANPDNLPEHTSLGEKKAKDLVKKARNSLRGGNRFQTGVELEQEQENMGTISTGSDDFDGLLKGGVGIGYTTEAYGKSSTGKTQLAIQLAVNNQLPEDEGGHSEGDKVVFIDTEDTFMTERFKQMAEAQGLDPDDALENVIHTAPTDLPDQEQAIKECRDLDLENVGIIIIDSIICHVRNQFKGRAEYGERADRMGDMLTELRKMAANHNLAVFYTNQAGDDPGVQYGDSTYAVGGNIMKHNSSFRIKLSDRQSKGFNAELVDSPHLPQNDVYYRIFREGIRDQGFESDYEDE